MPCHVKAATGIYSNDRLVIAKVLVRRATHVSAQHDQEHQPQNRKKPQNAA
jgi:hypothetical protein